MSQKTVAQMITNAPHEAAEELVVLADGRPARPQLSHADRGAVKFKVQPGARAGEVDLTVLYSGLVVSLHDPQDGMRAVEPKAGSWARYEAKFAVYPPDVGGRCRVRVMLYDVQHCIDVDPGSDFAEVL